MKRVITTVWRESPGLFLLSVLANLTNAVVMVYILSLISLYLSHVGAHPEPWWSFLIQLAVIIATSVIAGVSICRVSRGVVTKLRLGLVRHMLAAPLISVEAIGASSILNILNEDTLTISMAVPAAMELVRDLAFITAILAYLAWLSPTLLVMLLGVLVLAAGAFVFLQRRAVRHILCSRSTADRMYWLFRNLIDGIKQVQLSAQQREYVVVGITECEQRMRRSANRTAEYFTLSIASAFLFYLLLIYGCIYGRFEQAINPLITTSFMLAVILLLSPLLGVTRGFQTLTGAAVSMKRVDDLLERLASGKAGDAAENDNRELAIAGPARIKQSFEVSGLKHTYQTEDRQAFRLGPIDFVLRPGQSLFIAGGNGSGKTTLAKLLTGLYVPEQGEIRLDGQLIQRDNQAWYRGHFAAVFSDPCLFEGLSGTLYESMVNERRSDMERLKLNHVAAEGKGLLSQSASFSSGERRRVALLLASIEDRPVYVFDEFAADQDPECRDLFYDSIVTDLKARGKIVVVITHDARYFDRADFMLKLERGEPAKVDCQLHSNIGRESRTPERSLVSN
jgi:putative pyoverdin transport system ATP-binding/permease protein